MKILMTGATGYIGSKLSHFLLNQNQENLDLTLLVRQTEKSMDNARVHSIRADLRNVNQDTFQDKNYDVIIHLAALMADKEYLPKREFYNTNVEGTKKLILALAKSHIKQFIYISSVRVYGPTGIHPVKEELRYGGRLSRYAWSKMEAEKIAIENCRKVGIPLTILRPGLIYGEDMKYGWPHIIHSIEKGKMKIIGNGNALIQLSYIRDIVNGIALAIGNKDSYGKKINLCGEENCSIKEAFNRIAAILEVSPPAEIPFTPIYCLAQLLVFLPRTLKSEKLKLLTPSKVRFFKDNCVCDIEKARRILNFSPQFSLKEGLEKTIKAYTKSYSEQ